MANQIVVQTNLLLQALHQIEVQLVEIRKLLEVRKPSDE